MYRCCSCSSFLQSFNNVHYNVSAFVWWAQAHNQFWDSSFSSCGTGFPKDATFLGMCTCFHHLQNLHTNLDQLMMCTSLIFDRTFCRSSTSCSRDDRSESKIGTGGFCWSLIVGHPDQPSKENSHIKYRIKHKPNLAGSGFNVLLIFKHLLDMRDKVNNLQQETMSDKRLAHGHEERYL